MSTKYRVVVALVAVSLGVAVSCAQRSRSGASPAPEILAVGDVPGGVPVVQGNEVTPVQPHGTTIVPATPPGTVFVPVQPPGAGRPRNPGAVDQPDVGIAIAPYPVPWEDSTANMRRKMLNLPKYGDFVYVTELPEAIERSAPAYPDAARKSGVSGTVLVQALVLPDGTVGETWIVKSITPELDLAAAQAVRQWRFKPARIGDKATAVWVAVPVAFTLK